MLADKHVAVTGAGGSIGSVLCQRLLDDGVRKLTLISLTESGLYHIERRLRALASGTEIRPVLGSVCDAPLMSETLAGVDLVIHAAAHKHVPICEANPLAAIENNVGGTYTLALAAAAQNVGAFVLISSDKAVRPTSVMGATKRLAELLLRDHLANSATRFFTVRFGNVLGSDGSVVPLWREQIAKGGPVTLTDPRCERYFMSIPEAVDLILGTISLQPADGTFVFDMGEPKRLLLLAQQMISESGEPIEIRYIGLRPGEKLTEELFFGGDLRATAKPKIFRIEEAPTRRLDGSDLLDMMAAVRARDRALAVRKLHDLAS
jgi:FlaA1/EpsC-like NDP-sugar epimerase